MQKIDKKPIPSDLKCNKCKSTVFVRNGYNRKGIAQFKCKTCGSTRPEYYEFEAFTNPDKIPCTICGSTNITKEGRDKRKNGMVQRYTCRECNYRFIQTPPKRILTPADVKFMAKIHIHCNVNMKTLAQQTGQPYYKIQEMLKPYRIKAGIIKP